MILSQSIHESVFQSFLAFSHVLWEVDMAERVQIFELTSWVLASLMVVLISYYAMRSTFMDLSSQLFAQIFSSMDVNVSGVYCNYDTGLRWNF